MSFCVPTRGDERPGSWIAVEHLVPLPLVRMSHPGTYRAACPPALNLHFPRCLVVLPTQRLQHYQIIDLVYKSKCSQKPLPPPCRGYFPPPDPWSVCDSEEQTLAVSFPRVRGAQCGRKDQAAEASQRMYMCLFWTLVELRELSLERGQTLVWDTPVHVKQLPGIVQAPGTQLFPASLPVPFHLCPSPFPSPSLHVTISPFPSILGTWQTFTTQLQRHQINPVFALWTIFNKLHWAANATGGNCKCFAVSL